MKFIFDHAGMMIEVLGSKLGDLEPEVMGSLVDIELCPDSRMNFNDIEYDLSLRRQKERRSAQLLISREKRMRKKMDVDV
jgi:hypothetical protein